MATTGSDPTNNPPSNEKEVNTNESTCTALLINTELTKESNLNTLTDTGDVERQPTVNVGIDQNKDNGASTGKCDPGNKIANGQNLDMGKTTLGN